MKYHRTYLHYVDTVGYCTAPLAVQAATSWLWVACARAENSGLFLGAKAWGDKQWQALTNGQLKRRHIEQVVEAKLAAWEGDHLRVYGYDLDGQEAYQRDRDRFTAHRKRTQSAPGAHAEPSRSLQAPLDQIGLDQTELNQIKQNLTRAAAPSDDGADAGANPRRGGGAGVGDDFKNQDPRRKKISKPIAAIRAAIASGDVLALLRANGCRVDGKESEWMAAAAGLTIASLGTILAWADDLKQPILFPSGLTHTRETWRDLPIERVRAIGRQHAETLGTLSLLSTETP